MFTGIIKAKSSVKKIQPQNDGGLSVLISPSPWSVKAGASISINGVCSTVKKTAGKGSPLSFEYMPETLQKSNLGNLAAGDEVNLEQSLRASDRLDGHIVVGHVDTTAALLSIEEEGNAKVLKISPKHPKEFMKFLAPKGSVAVEGISLTVVEVGKDFFTVKVLPYTTEETNLNGKKKGAILNIEFDLLAKYLERLTKF